MVEVLQLKLDTVHLKLFFLPQVILDLSKVFSGVLKALCTL